MYLCCIFSSWHTHYQSDKPELFDNWLIHVDNPALYSQNSLCHNVIFRDIYAAHSSQITSTLPSALPSCPCCLQATIYKFSKLKSTLCMLLHFNLQKSNNLYFHFIWVDSTLLGSKNSDKQEGDHKIVAWLYFIFALNLSLIQYICKRNSLVLQRDSCL